MPSLARPRIGASNLAQKRTLTKEANASINAPVSGGVMLGDLSSIDQRLELLEKAGWVPDSHFCNLLTTKAPEAPTTIAGSLVTYPALAATANLNETIVCWVVKGAPDETVLAQLVPSIAACHFAIATNDDISNDERNALERAVIAWKAILGSSSEETQAKYAPRLRLALLKEFGFPCGPNFAAELHDLVGQDLECTSVANSFENRKDKLTIDHTLARWVSGEINEDIALYQLMPMRIHFCQGGVPADDRDRHGRRVLSPESLVDLPFADMIFNVSEAVGCLASNEVYEKHHCEVDEIELGKSGVAIESIRDAFKTINREERGKGR
jgi:hypothetical protein